MMWGYYPGMGWWMVLSTLLWLAVIGVAVWALVRFLAHQMRAGAGDRRGGPSGSPSAEEILRQRFARGEIDGEAFERMHRQLEAADADRGVPSTAR